MGATHIRGVADVPRVHAAVRPHRMATICAGRQTTFAELDRRASQIANGLRAEGVAAGSRIAWLDTNSDSFFEILFGTAKAKQVLVPVNYRLAAAEIAYIINDSSAEVLFVGAAFFGVVESIRADLPTITRIIAFNDSSSEWKSYQGWRDRQSPADRFEESAPSDVVLQMYTSGTTGQAKGAQLTNASLLSVLPDTLREYGDWNETDVNLVCLPLAHVGGCLWGLAGYYAGAANVVVVEPTPVAILRAVSEHRVTKIFLVPALIRFMLQSPEIETADLSSVSLLVYGGSPMSVELLRAAMDRFRCGFGQLYGLTETSGGITYLPPQDHHLDAGNRLLSCGRPLSQVQIRIVTSDDVDLPPGEIGEIVCRTPQTMKGYWQRPDDNARALRDGWLHTGDVGYVDVDGYLYIHDRVYDMIVTGGENVYPTEVERALLCHPGVADAAVIGVPDASWGESIKAFIVQRAETGVTAAEIVEFARQRIAGYKVPRSIEFVDSLPRNTSGKVLRRELRAPYWTGLARHVN